MTPQARRTRKVEKLARIYDEEIAPCWGTRFARLLLRNLAIPERGQVLDVSCGTGDPTVEILRRMSDGSRLIAIDESTIDHYEIYASPDGNSAFDLGGVAAGARSFDLAASCLGSGSYQVAVVAVGKAMIRDHASAWRPYTAP